MTWDLPPKRPMAEARQPSSTVLPTKELRSAMRAWLLVDLSMLDQEARPSSPLPRTEELRTVEFAVPCAKLTPSAKLLRIRAFSMTMPSV
ncbi:Uncharacterised protein [Mycobacteroides abscessus subsp. abscessus]|nr:Uncharacterised protein [Mycobacteroides abscessus subsp. abscessus]